MSKIGEQKKFVYTKNRHNAESATIQLANPSANLIANAPERIFSKKIQIVSK